MNWLVPLSLIFFGAAPATTNYQLNSYGFGSGGTANSSTATYSLEGTAGEITGQTGTTANYNVKPGYVETQQANVPKLSSFNNNGNTYYNKLRFIIDQQSNPSDAKYALQISTTSNFSSDINYVKSDLTIGPTLTTADYQTYTAWGGGTGSDIIGLTPSTTYYLRVKATQGQFTESAYGPSSTASTVGPQLSFDIDVSASDTETGPPYATNFGNLLAGSVIDSPQRIWFDFATNANSGGNIYIYGQYIGLRSSAKNYTIASASGDLGSLSEGFGAQSASAAQTSGGPLSALSPYNGASQNVGLLDTTVRQIYSTSNPVVGGRTSILLKAKSQILTPAATDYTDVITAVASGNF